MLGICKFSCGKLFPHDIIFVSVGYKIEIKNYNLHIFAAQKVLYHMCLVIIFSFNRILLEIRVNELMNS